MLVPHKSECGWVLEIPDDLAREMGVAAGSLTVLQPADGTVEVEVLPPPNDELRREVREIASEFGEAFA